MRLSFFECVAGAYLLLIPSAIADTAIDGHTGGDPFCLNNGEGGERRGAITGSCSPLAGIAGVFLDQRKNCYWAANVWTYQHDLNEVFTSSSTNTCGHCTTNFTCMAKTKTGLWGTDDVDVYENAQITAVQIYNGLQTTLSTCNPADGVCAIEWLNEDCLVQTYFAEQLSPTDCPDAPCPDGDLTCEVLDPSTCDDCYSD